MTATHKSNAAIMSITECCFINTVDTDIKTVKSENENLHALLEKCSECHSP